MQWNATKFTTTKLLTVECQSANILDRTFNQQGANHPRL
jgi:hypothetical protein